MIGVDESLDHIVRGAGRQITKPDASSNSSKQLRKESFGGTHIRWAGRLYVKPGFRV
jgi:hypothetical protein